jgi:hypothetical protein
MIVCFVTPQSVANSPVDNTSLSGIEAVGIAQHSGKLNVHVLHVGNPTSGNISTESVIVKPKNRKSGAPGQGTYLLHIKTLHETNNRNTALPLYSAFPLSHIA